jgi:hypothetical protein
MRRTAVLLLELAAAVVAGVVVLSGLLLWRLSQGPIVLDFLGPYVEAEMVRQGEGRGVRVAVGEVEVSWGGFQEPLRLRARRIEADGPAEAGDGDGGGRRSTRIAAVPELGVDLDLSSLVRGTVSPTEFELVGPQVFVTRLENGQWLLDVRPSAATPDQGQNLGEALLEAILSPPDPSQPLGRLNRLAIRDAEIVVDDLMAGFGWNASRADLTVERTAAGVRLELAASVRIGASIASFSIDVAHDREAGRTSAEMHTSGIPLRDLAAVAPELAMLGRLDWTVGADLGLELDRDLSVRTATARLDRLDGGGNLAASLGAVQPDGGRRFDLWIEDVALPALSPLLGEGDALAGLDIVVDGEVGLRIGADGRPGRGRASLRGGEGRIALPGLDMQAVETRSVLIDLAFEPDARLLELVRLDADLGGPRLSADGWAVLLPRERRAEWLLAASVRDVPLATALGHWPRGVKPITRSWIERHLSGGVADETSILLSGDVAFGEDGAARPRIDRVSGTADFRALDVAYLLSMPPVEGVSGSLRFDRERVEITTRPGARSAGLETGEATIVFTGLGTGEERAQAQIPLAGPLRDALRIVDHPPLRLLAGAGLSPDRFGGAGRGVLSLDFPARDGIRPDDVRFRVEATAEGASMRGAAPGIDLSDARLSLVAEPASFRVSGRGALNGVPAEIAVAEPLGDGRPNGTVEVAADLDAEALGRLSLPAPPGMRGALRARASIRQTGPDRRVADVRADLTQASLAIPVAGWEKPAGVPGTLRLTAPIVRDRVGAVRVVEAEAPGLSAVGTVQPTPDGRGLAAAEFPRLTVGGSSGRLSAERTADGAWRIRADGEALDLGPAIERLRGGGEAEGPRVEAALEFGRVSLGGDRELASAVAVVSAEGGRIRRADAAATAGGARVLLTAAPDGAATAFRIETAALGRALAALGLDDRLRGGRAVVAGRHEPDRPGGARTSGRIEVEGVHVVRQPVLARMLNVLSLTGLGDLLSSDGISFDEASADFVRDAGGLRIYDGRAWGGSLGVTGQGTLDAGTGEMELGGTIVPLYGINRVIGAIPLLGDVLTGGDGQGFLAANWRVSGPQDDPRVAVNPLSFFAPGFLRRLLFPTPSGELAQDRSD